MKKFTLLAVAALAMSFASCKKDYKCQCTYAETGPGADPSIVTTITIHETKSKATTACTSLNYSYVVGGITETETCVIQ